MIDFGLEDTLVGSRDRERRAVDVDLGDGVDQNLGVEPLCLALHPFHQIGPGDRFEAGEVLDFGGQGDLAADFVARDEQRPEIGARGVDRRRPARRPAADDDDVLHVRRGAVSFPIRPPAFPRRGHIEVQSVKHVCLFPSCRS